jgi:argininosuccinate synthase
MENTTTYKKVASHEAIKWEFDKCLLLYSGGLDTSMMLKWIQEEYNCKVIALTIDIWQTADDLEAIKQKAFYLWALDAVVIDAKDEFAEVLLSKAIKANADYQWWYALSTPLGRVIISEIAVKIAEKYDCKVIAHGCTWKWNDQVRFEWYITTLNPKMKTIAPVREWSMWRDEQIEYAEKNWIPVKQKKDKPYSYDENMWWNTWEWWEIENPEFTPKFANILQWCKTIEEAVDKTEEITIWFEKWIPTSLNWENKKLSTLIMELNKLWANHGIWVFPLIEDRLVWLKVRGVYENPAATILIKAHKNLEQLVSTREENELKTLIDTKWAYLTYAAKWYDPVMKNIISYIDMQNEKVSGTVTIKLYKWNVIVANLTSKYSLFDANLATFNKCMSFNQNSSAWFIEIYNLAQKTAYNVMK